MNHKTRTCFPSVPRLAEMGGVDETTIRRRLRGLEAIAVTITTFRKYACRSNHTSVYLLPVLDDDFFLSHPLPVGGGKNAPVKQLPETEKQPTTPRALARRKQFSAKLEPQKPVTDPEVYASEQRGQELRREHWQHVRGSHRNWQEWRRGKELQAARMAARASVGVSTWVDTRTVEQKQADDAANQELGRKYEAERKARAELQAKCDAEAARVCNRCGGRGFDHKVQNRCVCAAGKRYGVKMEA
jgi:hypothetical protein